METLAENVDTLFYIYIFWNISQRKYFQKKRNHAQFYSLLALNNVYFLSIYNCFAEVSTC